jgi:hypothetical protein
MSSNDGSELSPRAKALLHADAALDSVPVGSSERVLKRLSVTLPLAGLAVSTAHAAAAPSLPPAATAATGALAALAGVKGKLLLGVVVLGTALGALGVMNRSERRLSDNVDSTRAATDSSAKAPVHAASAPSAWIPEPTPLPSNAPLRDTKDNAPSISSPGLAPAPSAPASSLAEERALLDAARSALSSGNAGSALERLLVHERRYPRGLLAEERESLTVQALAHTGAAEAARKRFAAFKRRFPASIFLPALEAVVGSLP